MIDRPESGEQAILVHINFPLDGMQENLIEFRELACSAGAKPVETIVGTRSAPDPKYFVGVGKAEEIKVAVKAHNAELVIFNHALTSTQERNLERFLQCRVVDRTGLILDIFAQRARSFEGKLQVELALLKHQSTRLVKGWTHLERQRGGIGLRGGPGETQLEVDRRLIRGRIQAITKRLIRVKQQRDQSRKARKKAIIPTVALVGYTNAGKSTLFNHLTGADAYVANRLFATLDPTLRRIELPEVGPVILADTVGFIRHLPHDLVEAFHATLEEVCEADLLLHVVDAHDDNRQGNIEQVNEVLSNIGANEVPQLLVYNKIDLCHGLPVGIERNAEKKVYRVFISAEKNQGIMELQAAVTELLEKDMMQLTLVLTPQEGKLRALFYSSNAVQSEQVDEVGNYHLEVKMSKIDWARVYQRYPSLTVDSEIKKHL